MQGRGQGSLSAEDLILRRWTGSSPGSIHHNPVGRTPMLQISSWPVLLGALLVVGGAAAAERRDRIPRYEHILVIIAENHGYRQIIGSRLAPNLDRLAK